MSSHHASSEPGYDEVAYAWAFPDALPVEDDDPFADMEMENSVTINTEANGAFRPENSNTILVSFDDSAKSLCFDIIFL
jgi:hypothetical protein